MPDEERQQVTRREIDDLRQDLRDLRETVRELDREGSAATRTLTIRHEDLKAVVSEVNATVTWIIRGFIVAFVLAVILAVYLKGHP